MKQDDEMAGVLNEIKDAAPKWVLMQLFDDKCNACPLSFCVFIEIRMHVVPTGSRQSVPASLALSLKEIYEYESTPQHSKKLRHTLGFADAGVALPHFFQFQRSSMMTTVVAARIPTATSRRFRTIFSFGPLLSTLLLSTARQFSASAYNMPKDKINK